MSEQELKEAFQPVNEDDVISYLKKHPGFLVKHPELLNVLTPPEVQQGKGIADFQTFMVERLKKDKKREEAKAKSLIEMSRSNMTVQSRINAAVVRMLDANSFEEFVDLILNEMAVILDVDIITIVVQAMGDDVPDIRTRGVRVVEEGVVEHFLEGKDAKLESDCVGHEIIFGGGAGLVRSQALQRLDISNFAPKAMICFGSRNPEMFTPGQGTELIGFLANVIERMIRHWLRAY